jgi:MFS family permease
MTYGNCTVLVCFATMFFLYGAILNTFTVFLVPMVDDLGWDRTTLSIAMAVGAGGMGLTAPIAGMLIDRIGARRIMIAGAALIGGGILIAGRITQPWQIYILYAFVGIGLASASVIPCSLIISKWFISRRGMAMGMMAMGTSVGGMVMTPLANWIIYNYSWRAAYTTSGIMILSIGLPIIIFFLKPDPADAGFEPYVDPDLPVEDAGSSWGLSVKEALVTRRFWQIAAVMLIIGTVTSALGTHFVPHLLALEHSPTKAANTWLLVLFVMTGAKFAFGPIADRWGARKATAGACVVVAISILIAIRATTDNYVIMFAVLYGFGVGAPLAVNPILTSDALGMRNFGAIYGILTLVSIIGSGVGPVWAAKVFDNENSYVSVLYIFAVLMALSGVIAFFITSMARKNAGEVQGQTADMVE